MYRYIRCLNELRSANPAELFDTRIGMFLVRLRCPEIIYSLYEFALKSVRFLIQAGLLLSSLLSKVVSYM